MNAPASHFYALEASRHAGLGDDGAVRAGIAPYTTREDVDRLVEGVGPSQRRQPAPDQQLVPEPAVLGLQQHGLPVRPAPGPRPRGLQLQESLQPVHLRLAGDESGQGAGQPEGLLRQLRTHPVRAGRGRVALVEDQVDHGHHVGQPGLALGPGGQLEIHPDQGLLGPGDPLPDGGVLDQEAAGDLGCGEAADQTQRERGP